MIEYKQSYNFDDVTILPVPGLVESRKDVNLVQKIVTPHSHAAIESVGVIVSNMDSVGTFSMAKAMPDFLVALRKGYSDGEVLDGLKNYPVLSDRHPNVFITAGLENKRLGGAFSYICLDIANGHLDKFVQHVEKVRQAYPHAVIMAGNVVTAHGAKRLYNAGADIIKIGIAQGGHCNTKNKAGVGLSQVSAIIECRDLLPEEALICSDGGIKSIADICKAFALGANFVMAGTLFAGYKENETIWYDGSKFYQNASYSTKPIYGVTNHPDEQSFMKFYGMSSKTANEKYNGGLAGYKTCEGLETRINYKGSIQTLVDDIKGGLASCCTYSNCKNLQHLSQLAHVRITK